MADVAMPRLSDSMEEGTIVRWLLDDGAEVKPGTEIAEIETDKATMTYESEIAGTFHRAAEEGDVLPVGATMARILAAGEDAPAAPASAPEPAATPEPPAPPAPDASANGHGGAPEAVASAPAAATATATAGRPIASPRARALAEARGIDLATIVGSGPGGRIVGADLDLVQPGRVAAPPAAPAAPAPAPVAASTSGADGPSSAKGDVTIEQLSRIQSTIARRMAEAKATIPEFTLSVDVDMDAAVALRASLKQLGDTVPSYNDMVVKACALALRRHPRANASYKDEQFALHSRVNVGFAVALDDALVVPTVFDADTMSLGRIARETRALVERARSGELTAQDLGGGTFTVSNLGMFGVTSFTAVINPPQAAILAVGALEPRPVVRDGELVIGQRMTITLSSDHRILYGADAAAFLAEIREGLEQPLRLAF